MPEARPSHELIAGLTPKQRAFAEAYFLCNFNATKAAVAAGYSEASAYSQGSRLLKRDEVSAYIRARLGEAAMQADEVLARLGDQARGDMGDFISVKAGVGFLDLDKAQKAGRMHLVKKYAYSKKKGLEVELYDAQAAVVHLGRHHGLFKDRVEQTGEGLDVLRQFLGVAGGEDDAPAEGEDAPADGAVAADSGAADSGAADSGAAVGDTEES